MELKELAEDLENQAHGMMEPFPYEDCRKLQDRFGADFEAFIPDLDLYAYEIWSFGNAARRLLKWPASQLSDAYENKLAQSFFDVFPHYRIAESVITKEHTPDLYKLLNDTEQVRIRVRMLLEAILA